MAFLDNSGGIVLDAILTDEGRRKITQGAFRVVKFALGDDEVDYSMYDHGATGGDSGLQILKTPIFEAFEQRNANMHHGLQSYPTDNILYVPILKHNDRVSTAAKRYEIPLEKTPPEALKYLSGSCFYLAVNEETANKLRDEWGEEKYFLQASHRTATKIVVESGIDTGVPEDPATGASAGTKHLGTHGQRTVYLVEKGFVDRYYYIYCDTRFIKELYTPPKEAYFRTDRNGEPEVDFGVLKTTKATSLAPAIEGYHTFLSRGVKNEVFYYGSSMANSPLNTSAIAGPRGSVTAFNFEIGPELTTTSHGTRNFKYSVYGKIDQFVTNVTDKYDIIDTMVSVEGINSNSMLKLPIRIIRYAGTLD